MEFTKRARCVWALALFACLSHVALCIETSSPPRQTIRGIETGIKTAQIKSSPHNDISKSNSLDKSSSRVVPQAKNLPARVWGKSLLVRQEQKQQQQQQEGPKKYGIVVDCGSSGTRAAIYTWPMGAHPDEIAYEIEPLKDPASSAHEPVSIRIRPGLASVRNNPNYASDYMAPIMEFASKYVPAEQQASTPVYIIGTAGMRLLTQQERDSIIDDLNRDLRRKFNFQDIRPEVISGVVEGVFQWVSVNSLAGRLTPQFDLPGPASPAGYLQLYRQTRPQHRQARRMGLIEMGGASAQIAFEVNPAMRELIRRRLKHQGAAWPLLSSSVVDLNLYGDDEPDVSVFSVSFLGFGSDSVRTLATDLLVRDSLARLTPFVSYSPSGLISLGALEVRAADSNTKLTVDDPCLPLGSEQTVSKPLELLSGQAKTIGYELATDERQRQSEAMFSLRLIGKGNYGACQALLNRLAVVAKLEQTTCNVQPKKEPCEAPLIGTNFVPWLQLQWIGLGELYYTPHYMLDSQGPLNGPVMRLRTARLCSSSWDAIQTQYEAASEFERRRNLLACFKATWIITWLATVLHMPLGAAPTAIELQTTTQVNGTDVDWKLGAIITKTVNGN